MPRRVTLFALWAVFAVASVSVGFGAASLVSDPFTDVGSNAGVSDLAGSGDAPVTEPDGGPSEPATETTAPPTKKPSTRTPTQTPASTGGTGSAEPTKSPRAPSSPATVKRGISTRGGYVSATCRGQLVSVGAAPAVWWKVDSMTRGQVRSARVRLEPAHDANGERVEVTASCSGGTPVFTTDYHDGGGGDDGGGDDGGGGDGSGGSGGSGGSEGSSGSGDG